VGDPIPGGPGGGRAYADRQADDLVFQVPAEELGIILIGTNGFPCAAGIENESPAFGPNLGERTDSRTHQFVRQDKASPEGRGDRPELRFEFRRSDQDRRVRVLTGEKHNIDIS
jgi:hypothetical protein